MNPVAEINEKNEIVDISFSPREFEKKEGWAISSIANAIKRKGKTHNRRFINISEKEYYIHKPIVLKINPVSTIPIQREVG